ncbi:MAG: hypothetical protein Q9217_001913 [Psora testacea]
MFKIFSSNEKPAPSHTRSKTLPDFPQLTSELYPPPPPFGREDGQQLARLDASTASQLNPDQLAGTPREPGKSHQRNLTEHLRSPRDLPLLITLHSTEQRAFHSPSASVLQSSDSQYTPLDHTHQISFPRGKGKTPSIFTGEKSEAPGKLAKWFDGESEPVKIGLIPSPKKLNSDPFESTTSLLAARSSASLQRKSASQVASKPAMASRFSFFSSKSSLAKPPVPPIDIDDELLKLNVSTAFKPFEPNELHSPASLKSLQQQAEILLVRLQAAYRDRTTALKEVIAEKETLAEETQGAQTKSKQLQIQLGALTAKLDEQDEAMMNLVDELAQEKLARREVEEARKRSVRLVEHETRLPSANGRRSIISDKECDSEDDSSAESVFSRHNGTHSPAMSLSSVSTTSSPDGPHYAEIQRITPMPPASRLRIPPFQTLSKSTQVASQPYPQSCANCEGVRASEAWTVVSILKEENQGLKQRVGELEGALDGCLDVVDRLGG